MSESVTRPGGMFYARGTSEASPGGIPASARGDWGPREELVLGEGETVSQRGEGVVMRRGAGGDTPRLRELQRYGRRSVPWPG